MNFSFMLRWLLPLAILQSSCSGGGEDTCPSRGVGMRAAGINEPAYCQNFSSTLIMKNRMGQQVNQFSAGEIISFENSVVNNSGSDVTITKTSGCPQVSFEVYNTTEPNIVWGSSDGQGCTASLEPVTFAPGETKIFSGEWNQTCGNLQAARGPYTVRTLDSTECWMRIDRNLTFTLQ
jgi:Intracellular proteinase inhibitor